MCWIDSNDHHKSGRTEFRKCPPNPESGFKPGIEPGNDLPWADSNPELELSPEVTSPGPSYFPRLYLESGCPGRAGAPGQVAVGEWGDLVVC